MVMQTSDPAATLARVRRLERQVWWLMSMMVLLVLGAVAYGWVERQAERHTESSTRTVEGEVFILRSRDGSPTALLSNAKKGPLLYINKEKRSLHMQVVDDGTAILLHDENVKVRAKLAVEKEDATLQLFNSTGKGGIKLSVGKDGSTLALLDEAGKARVKLAVTKEGPQIKLFDENGKAIVSRP